MSEVATQGSRSLDAGKITSTIEQLSRRVEHRFPDSGLARVCRELEQVAAHTAETAAWIGRPIYSLRVAVATLVILIVGGLVGTLMALGGTVEPLTFTELVQALEAGINDVVLIGAAIFFLITLETRVKRRRALKAIHELRSIAHVIDMHQLTKDPERVLQHGRDASVVPRTPMTAFDLSRYLDYCSELLSLTGKVAALYIQNFDDPVALQSVNEVEGLTTGLSRKIWQKLMIVYSAGTED